MPINYYSLASLKISVGFQNTEFSKATGFYVCIDDRCFLITNWHVVTGRHFETKEPLSTHAGVPSWLNVAIRRDDAPTEIRFTRFDLFDNDEPCWFEHPTKEIDVVALLVPRPSGCIIHPIDLARAELDVLNEPSNSVSIIGYPSGFNVDGNLPVWKTGHIASEVDYDVNGRDAFLIDATTRAGMSGSPVIRWLTQNYRASDGKVMFLTNPGAIFLGVYSGRLSESSELGYVWKPQVISELLKFARQQVD